MHVASPVAPILTIGKLKQRVERNKVLVSV